MLTIIRRFTFLFMFLIVTEQHAQADFIVIDGKTASWPEPSMIMIYIPAGLAGADRMNFEMGINSWVMCLPNITVGFKDGAPTAGEKGSIGVTLVPDGTFGDEFASTSFMAGNPPSGQTHGSIMFAMIQIENQALGHNNLMKNIGAHEFGHALGLADDPGTPGTRVNVMDPDFGQDDPFIAPSARDKKMAMEHYSVVPEPATLVLLGTGLVGVFGLARKRRRAQQSE